MMTNEAYQEFHRLDLVLSLKDATKNRKPLHILVVYRRSRRRQTTEETLEV